MGNGQPFSISISDSSRFLLIQASVFTNIPFDFELTADLSDNLGVIPVPVLGGGGGNNVSSTPLPAALPLFATGLGALGLLGWRRKRKNAAAFAAA